MSRIVAIGALSAVLLLGSVPAAVAAGSGTGATPVGTVSYSLPDVQLDGPMCVAVPVTFNFTKLTSEAWQADLRVVLDVRQAGSNRPETVYGDLHAYDGLSGVVTETFFVCPERYDPDKGPLLVTGTIKGESRVTGETTTAPVSSVTVGVLPNEARLSPMRITAARYGGHRVQGTATVLSATKGRIGVEGRVDIYVKSPGSTKWRKVTSALPDQFGRWSSYLDTDVKPGSVIRAQVSGCTWCTDAVRMASMPR